MPLPQLDTRRHIPLTSAPPSRESRSGVAEKARFSAACSHIWSIVSRQLGGGLAQLGERLNGIQEVRGSSPLSSTSMTTALGRYGVQGLFFFVLLKERPIVADGPRP